MLHVLSFLVAVSGSPQVASLSIDATVAAPLQAFVNDGAGDAHALGTQLRNLKGSPRSAVDTVNAVFAKDRADVASSTTSPRLERLRALIDATAAQKDGWASALAWHTDLAAAKAEAARTGKPILSLRLLGRLDEDLSCANSRFFRTLLYVDPAVQQQLSKFVLHWQTVRPAPKLTIDMGDGRVLTTTITGNSAHLILDKDGSVVDALPGLLGPQQFAEMLENASFMAQNAPNDRAAAHVRFRESDARDWSYLSGNKPLPLVGKSARGPRPLAVDAGPLAMTKAMPEMPVVRALSPVDVKEVRADPAYDELASKLRKDIQFSDAAQRLISRKLGKDQSLAVVVDRLRTAVAKDTVINRYVLHDAVRSWLAAGVSDAAVVQDRLYDELFLTPKADPWLGLVDEGAYVGVDAGGIR